MTASSTFQAAARRGVLLANSGRRMVPVPHYRLLPLGALFLQICRPLRCCSSLGPPPHESSIGRDDEWRYCVCMHFLVSISKAAFTALSFESFAVTYLTVSFRHETDGTKHLQDRCADGSVAAVEALCNNLTTRIKDTQVI